MSPRRTRRGTVRENVSEVSIDNSTKSAKKTRKTRQVDQSKLAKSSEEDSDSQVDVNVSVSSATTLNETSKSTRKRRKPESSADHNRSGEALNESKGTRSTRNDSKVAKSKRQKTNKSVAAEASSLVSEDESFNTKTPKPTRQTSKKKIKSDTVSPDKNESKVPKTSSSRKLLKTKISADKVTPESSPVSIPLTPHRSTKTPKKSPVNIGSPKTHSRMSLKSLKVPRKLITEDSPSSEKTIESSQNATFLKSITCKLVSPPKKEKSVSPSFKISPRFSRSPKIVLKSLKSISKINKKSPSQKVTSRAKKAVKINLSQETENLNLSSDSATEKKSENNELESTKSLSPLKSATLSKTDTTSEKLTPNSKKSPTKSSVNKSQNTSLVNSTKTSKVSLSSKSLFESSLKSPNQLSTSSSKTPKTLSSTKSKKTPKFISPFYPGKTPKIVFATKSKISLKKSPKLKRTPSKSPTSKKPSKKSPKTKKVLVSPQEKNFSKGTLDPNDVSMSPRVVINKLTTSEYNSSISNIKNSPVNKNSTPVKSTASESQKAASVKITSPKSPKLNKSSVGVKSVLEKSVSEVFRKSITSKSSTPSITLNKRFSNLKPLTSSTPREKPKQNPLNLSLSSKTKISRRLNNQSSIKKDDLLLDDVSEPSINDSSLIPMSAIFDSDNSQNEITIEDDENDTSILFKTKQKTLNSSKNNKNSSNNLSQKKNAKDDTYEVEDPKTPKFKKNAAKRKLDEGESNLNEEQDRKRSCKVHFASPSGAKVRSSGINRVGTPGHAIQKRRTPMLTEKLQTSISNQSSVSKVENKKKPALTPSRTPKNPSAIKKQITSTIASRSNKKIQENQVSTSKLGKLKPVVQLDKKLETKTPTKKIPNFAEIHQKNFAKMESLVDLKKRVEERHVLLNTAPSSVKKLQLKQTAGDSTNGVYNRFGFKVRKNEAINMISKKQAGTTESREKKREDARSALKGVRMNRRFELQMKSRMRNT